MPGAWGALRCQRRARCVQGLHLEGSPALRLPGDGVMAACQLEELTLDYSAARRGLPALQEMPELRRLYISKLPRTVQDAGLALLRGRLAGRPCQEGVAPSYQRPPSPGEVLGAKRRERVALLNDAAPGVRRSLRALEAKATLKLVASLAISVWSFLVLRTRASW